MRQALSLPDLLSSSKDKDMFFFVSYVDGDLISSHTTSNGEVEDIKKRQIPLLVVLSWFCGGYLALLL